MGYTHYFYRTKTLNLAKFKAWVVDVRQIIEKANIPICGWDGTGEPDINDLRIRFNGDASCEADHETFVIPRVFPTKKGEFNSQDDKGRYFGFCKTAMKPYDVVVTAALIRFKYHFPNVLVSSDGDPQDWEPGMELCRVLFGEAKIPFTDANAESDGA